MSRPPTYPVVLLRPGPSLLWFTLPLAALGLLLLLSGWSSLLGLVFIWCSSALLFQLGRGKSKRKRVPGQLRIDARGLALDGASIAARRSLRGGLLVPSEDPIVRLTRAFPRGPIDIEVRDAEDGHALLRALGFDTSQSAASFRLGSLAVIRRIPLNAVLVFWGFVMMVVCRYSLPLEGPSQLAELSFPVLGALALAAWLGVYFKSTSFVVGADGIYLRWLWTRRFIPYAEIRGVGVDGFKLAKKGLILELSRGPALRFPVRAALGRGPAEDEASCVVARIREALALFQSRQSAGEVRLPDRGKRPVAAWIQALRSVGSEGAVDHRTAPITAEALWRIAEDPKAEKVARAGAAVALGARLDAAGKARLRVAAAATAAPDLRAVLEVSAEEADEERLSRALSLLTRE